MIARGWAALVAVFAAILWVGPLACQPRDPPAVPALPVRVVSLTVASDEILLELLPPERVAGVSAFADSEFSNAAGRWPSQIPRVRADLESVAALQPDLIVVASYSRAEFLEALTRLGLPSFRISAFESFDDIEANIRHLGRAVGESSKAEVLATRFSVGRRRLAQRVAGRPRPRVLYWDNGSSAGVATTYDSLIREAGGTNVWADSGQRGYMPVTAEQVMVLNPDWLLVPSNAGSAAELARLRRHPLLGKLPAVAAGHVLVLPTRQASSVSHHVLSAAEALADRLHFASSTESAPSPSVGR